jgi:hypothetical protein
MDEVDLGRRVRHHGLVTLPSDPTADPGWSGAFRSLAWIPIPGLAARRLQTLPDGLVALRVMFMTFTGGRACIGVVVAALAPTWRLDTSVLATGVGALAVAVVGLAERVGSRLLSRPLDHSSPEALAGGYRTRFFLRLAFADASATVGFAGFVLTANPALHALAVGFAAVRFARLAPSARNLAEDQAELQMAGCSQSLVAALRAGSPPRRNPARRPSGRMPGPLETAPDPYNF